MSDEVGACGVDIGYFSVHSDCPWCSGYVMFPQRPGMMTYTVQYYAVSIILMQFNWINATGNDLCGEPGHVDELIRCDISFVSIFVIPAILLLLTYIYGVYLFWGKHEYLENLAGQV